MQDYFKQCFVLHCSEKIFSFLIKKSRLKIKAIEIETASFHSFGNPKGSVLDYFLFFNFSYKLIPISMPA